MVEPEEKQFSRTRRQQKSAPTRADWASAPEKPASSPVARFITLFVILGLAITLAAGYWGYGAWIEQSRQGQLEAFSRQHAVTTAGAVSDRLKQIQKQLEGLAANTDAASVLASGDEDAITALERRLANFFTDAESLRALPVGAATAVSTDEQLTFTELDMVARAERRGLVLPEAARQGDQWFVKFAAPVPPAEGTVRGSLLLTIPIDTVEPALAAGNEGYGQAEVLQSFNERQSNTLLRVGAGNMGDPQTVDVPDSHWRLRFTPSLGLWRETQVNQAVPLAALTLFALAMIALAIVLGRWLGHRQQGRPARGIATSKAAGGTNTAPGKPDSTSPGKARQSYDPQDILDIEIAEEDEALLGLDDPAESENATTGESVTATPRESLPRESLEVPEVIFRAYDIRGRFESELTPELALQIGQALGSEALDNQQDALIVARDVRTHSPLLAEQLIQGILSTGCRVINLGVVPTPLMYFATETLPQTQSGVMVTASHNGAEYNGFKVVMTGKSRSAEDIRAIRTRILAQDFYTGRGTEEHVDIVPQYIDTIFSDVALAGEMHLVLDAGNGVAGLVAPQLFEELGCRVTCIHCEPDGNFPNHAPDPSVSANLCDLVAKVKEEQADLGIAFDGDGDRLTVVSPQGEIIWADRLLMLFAKDIVGRNPGADVVFDIKSTRQLNSAISGFGGRPIMWKTGHAPMRAKMMETGALLGGEFSGHVFIKDRWYGFDDGIYAAARLVEILSLWGQDLDAALEEFPPQEITPEILIPVAEEQKFAIVRQLTESGDFGEAKLTTLDGLRADFPRGWGLIRPSNTSAKLSLRFEAESKAELDEIQALFKRELAKATPDITLDW